MKRDVLKVVLVLVVAMSVASYGATVAQWDFEDGSAAGTPFTPIGQPNGSGGSADLVSGALMRGWDATWGPSFSNNTPDGSVFSSRNNGQDGYLEDTYGDPGQDPLAAALNGWSPSTWTVETSVFLYDVGGWKTMIGKDGSSQAEPESDFYLSNNGIDNRFRINFDTVGGQRWILDSSVIPVARKWYGLAATSDGATLSLYLDDGTGYVNVGTLDISAQTVAQNAMAATSTNNWTFGRGWYNGGFVDHINGNLDNIRFSDVALGPDDLIALTIPEPATMLLLGLGALTVLKKRK